MLVQKKRETEREREIERKRKGECACVPRACVSFFNFSKRVAKGARGSPDETPFRSRDVSDDEENDEEQLTVVVSDCRVKREGISSEERDREREREIEREREREELLG